MKVCWSGIAGAVALLLTSCATQVDPTRETAWAAAVPPPEVSIDLPLELPKAGSPRFCQLGATCLSMDPRPFEPCLLSTKHCSDKATEPLLARGLVVPGGESRDNSAPTDIHVLEAPSNPDFPHLAPRHR